MRLVVQRVRRASVSWLDDGRERRESIERGFLVLVGAGAEDTEADIEWLARKVVEMRVFADAAGRSNLSLADVGGQVLAVSQFTLFADLSRGRRPGFLGAGDPIAAERHYEQFVEAMRRLGVQVSQGRFGASMLVSLENDGPVTVVLSTDAWNPRV